jgi:8-oxo-dGTP diphosphatase
MQIFPWKETEKRMSSENKTPTDKELVEFLWNRVMEKASGYKPTQEEWSPLCSMGHAWQLAYPLREGEVSEFPLFITFADDGGMYFRATVHHQYDFTPIASCVDEKNPARAICMVVYEALKRLDEKKDWDKSKFWQMWQKPETPKVGVGVVLRKMIEFPSFGNLPETKQEKVLLGLRKGAHGAGQWSLPGGHMELGEDFLGACKREVLEETGITIRGIRKLDFTNDIFEKDGLHYVTLFFEAEWEEQEPKNPEPDKTERWEWFGVHVLPDGLFPPLRQAIFSEKEPE